MALIFYSSRSGFDEPVQLEPNSGPDDSRGAQVAKTATGVMRRHASSQASHNQA